MYGMYSFGNEPAPPTGRCPSTQGSYRCVGQEHHGGPHWAPVGDERAVRWGIVDIGCADPECTKDPGHPLPHNNGRGKSWAPAHDFPSHYFEVRFEVAMRR